MSFQAYSLMMKSITRSLNIVEILTKNKNPKPIFSKNYLFGLHIQDAIVKLNIVKRSYLNTNKNYG